MTRIATALFICLGLCACGRSDQTTATTPDARSDSLKQMLATLPTDIAQAEAELERRLDAGVQVIDGLVILRDPITGSLGISIFPANSSWILNCGIAGISIAFGAAISGDGGSVGSDAEIQLALTSVDPNICDMVGPMLGKHLQTMLQGG